MILPPDSPAVKGLERAWGDPLRQAIVRAWRAEETTYVESLLPRAELSPELADRVANRARALVTAVRTGRHGQGGLDAFMQEFSLSSQEGVVLLCLAEALLRIPDSATADRLIRDKIAEADWQAHIGHSHSVLVNASTWALMLTGRVVKLDAAADRDFGHVLGRLVSRSGEPVIRQSLIAAMRILGGQFIMGRTVAEALKRAASKEHRAYRYSFDMLGEAARTADAAARYQAAYAAAIAAIGDAAGDRGPIEGPGISIKLSALHPRFEAAQLDAIAGELQPRLLALLVQARAAGIGVTIDAEEADRLEPSLDLLEAMATAPELAGWDGLGLAVQAYQKRAFVLIDWLAALAHRRGRSLMVRLVKGAYWDTEIKRAQIKGVDGYPVFTRKASTDVSYLACARKLLADPAAFYPQFATHNAHTLAAVEAMAVAAGNRRYEFQRLHGMGEPLYAEIVKAGTPVRVYAPVGGHADLLAYLARRLLENGANSSFVNRITDAAAPIEALIADPVDTVRGYGSVPHPKIPLPRALYGADRVNALGYDLADLAGLRPVAAAMTEAMGTAWHAAPLVSGRAHDGPSRTITDPADRRRTVGEAIEAQPATVTAAVAAAAAAATDWDRVGAAARAACLERAALLLEDRLPAFMAMAVREAGKTIPDALAEVREAVDFLRYYAAAARRDFAGPEALPGPTGERNEVALRGRGALACISPWNFPLAIFTGQVAAALAAGNTVLAKPAEQTPLIAAAAVRLLHEAGVPPEVLHLLPGAGDVGARLIADPAIAGVAFTGSTETAWAINRALAAKDGPIVPLIAETGGQNAMIIDSSALPEQVVDDVVTSSFRSAGQRCSALRVLFVQDEIAAKLLPMLIGAMAALRVGDPALLATDVGPVIDAGARAILEAHASRMAAEGTALGTTALDPATANGTFVAPQLFEIDGLARLTGEVFGPILHIVRYGATGLDKVIDAVNATGYGLTVGVHSRIDTTVARIARSVRAGNVYVNRNMIGAVVGVQPFGGEGLSGTGPKAGGPRTLHRFATERTLSIDTTAAGGNAALMSLGDEAS